MYQTGLLPLNKPIDMRSTRCVEMVKKILGRKIKIGHGGTLDSTASGLLIILVGRATRLSNFVMDMPKCYETTAQLGGETTTDDASGERIFTAEWKHISESQTDHVLAGFMGWRMQSPPKISAVHVDGRRAHRLTRDGHDVEIPEKPVYFANVERTSDISADGKISFRVYCRKGTYIRSFVRDLGRKLGCGAYVAELNRLSTGPLTTENALDAAQLSEMGADELTKTILPITSVCPAFTCYIPNTDAVKKLSNGLSVSMNDLNRVGFGKYSSGPGNLLVSSDEIFSICERKESNGTFSITPVMNIIY